MHMFSHLTLMKLCFTSIIHFTYFLIRICQNTQSWTQAQQTSVLVPFHFFY
uniref:Uncharacterized protein n=1 Tax=Sander lucioperca TaxID=283035 RepID=A0A8D0A712_SANLU